jgi:hypothetical protein
MQFFGHGKYACDGSYTLNRGRINAGIVLGDRFRASSLKHKLKRNSHDIMAGHWLYFRAGGSALGGR